MSIKNVFITSMLIVGIITALVLGFLGVYNISNSVQKEAQSRVNHDLTIAENLYEQKFNTLALYFYTQAEKTSFAGNDPASILQALKQQLDLTVLNMCDVDGNPIAGNYADKTAKIPVEQDPILRKALEGKPASGTVLLDAARLYLEGGKALQNAMTIFPNPGSNKPVATAALFYWMAYPIQDKNGKIVSLLYGGKTLNYNFKLVDEIRDFIFGNTLYKNKSYGTVTIFMDKLRIATNVLTPTATRAVGTYVSDVVRQVVLQNNEIYHGKAWVVDSWYLSGYLPLHDPTGKTIGMLYVGLLEEPYLALRTNLILHFILPAIFVFIITIIGAVLIANRITQPLEELCEAALKLSRGDWDITIKSIKSYLEINHLVNAFQNMQANIKERDQKLIKQNEELSDINDELEKANRNYMQMLGFVTHELKSPLAAIQSIISNLISGLMGEIPEKVKYYLIRIQRNCEDLQDMVKNYLDLSRVERGELVANKNMIDFCDEVVEPSIQNTQELFDARHMHLQVECPDKLEIYCDAELMRIALSNYLTNAAKYGCEQGHVTLEVSENDKELIATVWNEGPGFADDDKEKLFGKFSRLHNKNTRDKKGSGLGLYLCKYIVEAHSGHVWAESEIGKWAKFGLSIPKENPVKA